MAGPIQLTFDYHHSAEEVDRAVERMFQAPVPYRILKRSIDARHHRAIKVHYVVTTDLTDPAEEIYRRIGERKAALKISRPEKLSPVVVGSGPGGIFCAWWLLLHGLRPILLEQGPPMRERIVDMARFMKRGELKPLSNICMGAGGAGTWSDGKLITRIRSGYIPFVMDAFVRFGAPESIRWLYNPHLGSNRIRHCIAAILDRLAAAGVSVRYNTRMTGLRAAGDGAWSIATAEGAEIAAPALFLAIGHSARESYALLRREGVAMEAKPFAVGVRVEHPARRINEMQYGEEYLTRYEGIETAQYKFAITEKQSGRGVYAFCMCPGGYVLNASTDEEGVVTNGMSNYLKAGRYSNAAVVVNVSLEDLEREGCGGTDGALEFQRSLEGAFRRAVNEQGSHVLPAQRLEDFLAGRPTKNPGPASCLNPVRSAELHRLFPDFLREGLVKGFAEAERKMKSFSRDHEAQLFAVESRTSSPYRILRDRETFVSPTHPNLYPVGEGAGFAGGITSAAVDGIEAAERYLRRLP